MHRISYWDLDFDRVAVPFLSTAGVPQVKLVRVRMPRIPPSVIKGVFFLYANADDAEAGRDPGGTGFVVRYDGWQGKHVLRSHFFYGVTNHHVACDGYPVIRLNKLDGGIEVLDLNPDQWSYIPGKYDVAATPLQLDDKIHDVSSISTRQFVVENGRPEISVGEDTFMIGLFLDTEKTLINVPVARFGHVSMLPNEKAKVEQENGFWNVNYIVDMHSRTGFSGSPVYVYRTFGSDLTNVFGHDFEQIEITNVRAAPGAHLTPNGAIGHFAGSGRLRVHNLFNLLGIHWAQFPEEWDLKEKDSLTEARQKQLANKGTYVEGMSGLTCVIPAWQIYEVLNVDELKKLRGPASTFAVRPPAAKPESARRADEPDSDANPNHLGDFKRLVDVAARKRPQGDQT